jgi:hypothetical protein
MNARESNYRKSETAQVPAGYESHAGSKNLCRPDDHSVDLFALCLKTENFKRGALREGIRQAPRDPVRRSSRCGVLPRRYSGAAALDGMTAGVKKMASPDEIARSFRR